MTCIRRSMNRRGSCSLRTRCSDGSLVCSAGCAVQIYTFVPHFSSLPLTVSLFSFPFPAPLAVNGLVCADMFGCEACSRQENTAQRHQVTGLLEMCVFDLCVLCVYIGYFLNSHSLVVYILHMHSQSLPLPFLHTLHCTVYALILCCHTLLLL